MTGIGRYFDQRQGALSSDDEARRTQIKQQLQEPGGENREQLEQQLKDLDTRDRATVGHRAPIIIGIGGYEAGYVEMGEDGKYRAYMHPAVAFDGYEDTYYEQQDDGEMPNLHDVKDTQEVARMFGRPVPAGMTEIITGQNDTDEAGYVIVYDPSRVVEVPISDDHDTEFNYTTQAPSGNRRNSQEAIREAVTKEGEVYASTYSTRDGGELINYHGNPETEAWAYPDRDQ